MMTMTFFAAANKVTTEAIPGGISISAQQYADAIEAMCNGLEIAIVDNDIVTRPPQPSADHEWVDGAWVDPTPEPEPEPITLTTLPSVSHAQIIGALIIAEIITQVEGIDWIKGTLPTEVEAAIALLPAEQQTIATLRAIRPSEVSPSDPLVAALATAKGKTEAEMVALFQLAHSL
jgi:hypothetical protein